MSEHGEPPESRGAPHRYSEENQPSRRRGAGAAGLVKEALRRAGVDSAEFLAELVGRARDPGDRAGPALALEMMRHLAPPPRATVQPVDIAIPEGASAAEQMRIITAAATSGQIPPDVAAMLAGLVKDSQAVAVVDELIPRLEAAERALADAEQEIETLKWGKRDGGPGAAPDAA